MTDPATPGAAPAPTPSDVGPPHPYWPTILAILFAGIVGLPGLCLTFAQHDMNTAILLLIASPLVALLGVILAIVRLVRNRRRA